MERTRINERYKLPARASFYYIMSTVIGKGAAVLVTPIFTRAMDAGEFGAYSYYISVLSIVSLLGGVFLSPAVIYSGLGKFKEEKSKLENSAIIITSTISTVICLVLFTFNGVFGIEREFAFFIFLQTLFDAVINAELISGKYSYDYTKVVAINLISALLSPVISLFFVLHLGMGATGRILGLLLASGAVAIAMIFRRVKNGIKPATTHTSYLLKNSLPLIPSILARATMGWSDKLIIKSYLGVVELAKYSVAHTVGMALFGIIGSLSSAMNPWIIRKLSAGRRDLISPVIKNLTELISFGAVFIIGLAPEILSFLAPSGYLDSLFVIIPFAVSTVPYFLFSVSSVIITYSEKTKLISLAASAGAAVNLILNLFFISELGSVGGALSYLVAELLIFLLSLRLLGSLDTSLKEKMKNPFPLVFATCSAAVLSLLYRSLAIRLLLLIIPACLAVNRGFKCLSLVREKSA